MSPTPTATPTGRVALVTGASSGIGLVTARALAARGDVVVAVSRGGGRGERVAADLARETGGSVHHLAADLSSVAEARALVDAFRARWDRLDVLVLNAGAFYQTRRLTPEGFEATWALNHLGVAVPAILLADLLTATPAARVLITSSNAAMGGRMHWDDLGLARYSGFAAYAQSKLANQIFTLAFAQHLRGSDVVVHAMHPGFVATDFGVGAGPLTGLVRVAQRLFARTPAQGADTLIYLATDSAARERSGAYWVDRRMRPMARGAQESGAADRLWRVTLEQARLSPPAR
jgi:retinol dehydrogenase 12